MRVELSGFGPLFAPDVFEHRASPTGSRSAGPRWGGRRALGHRAVRRVGLRLCLACGPVPGTVSSIRVFLTDFIGTKAMRWRSRDLLRAWISNLGFVMSHVGPDVYVYIGDGEEIPDERFGLLLPRRRRWARRHCRFVRPIVCFDPESLPDRPTLRRMLHLPEAGPLFVATVGPEGNHARRAAIIERVFEDLRRDFPGACFIMVCPESGSRKWIDYRDFVDGLHRYFAASDFVITQSGYGKVSELSAIGVPFIAIPLDYHFEQEHFMGHRLAHHGVGELVTMRDHDPQVIAAMVRRGMERPPARIDVDSGREVAEVILEAGRTDRSPSAEPFSVSIGRTSEPRGQPTPASRIQE